MMKRLIVTAALLLTGAAAFNAVAAEEISREQAKEMDLEMLGTIDTTSTSSPMDAAARLSKKADDKGGRYYVIIAEDERNRTLATAEVYK